MPQSYQCARCRHYEFAVTCAAFPDGIPIDIFTGQFDHTKPYPNAKNPQDSGIRFEPIKDTEGPLKN